MVVRRTRAGPLGCKMHLHGLPRGLLGRMDQGRRRGDGRRRRRKRLAWHPGQRKRGCGWLDGRTRRSLLPAVRRLRASSASEETAQRTHLSADGRQHRARRRSRGRHELDRVPARRRVRRVGHGRPAIWRDGTAAQWPHEAVHARDGQRLRRHEQPAGLAAGQQPG